MNWVGAGYYGVELVTLLDLVYSVLRVDEMTRYHFNVNAIVNVMEVDKLRVVVIMLIILRLGRENHVLD